MRPLVFLFLAQGWAAPSAAAQGHGGSAIQVIFPLINFLIFLYLVKRFLLPSIRDYLRSRREEILNTVKEAGEGRRRALERVQEYRERLKRLDEETRKIREALLTDAEREKAKLLAEARELAVKIRADTDFLTEQELKLARQRMRAEIARSAQAAARKIIEDHLTPADQKRLVEEFLTGVQGVR